MDQILMYLLGLYLFKIKPIKANYEKKGIYKYK